MVRNKHLENNPVTLAGITNACVNFVPDIPVVSGKTVKYKPRRVKTRYLEIPNFLYQLHKFVILNEDVMLVNGVPFLTNILENQTLHR